MLPIDLLIPNPLSKQSHNDEEYNDGAKASLWYRVLEYKMTIVQKQNQYLLVPFSLNF